MGYYREDIRDEIVCGLKKLQFGIMNAEWCRIIGPHRPLLDIMESVNRRGVSRRTVSDIIRLMEK